MMKAHGKQQVASSKHVKNAHQYNTTCLYVNAKMSKTKHTAYTHDILTTDAAQILQQAENVQMWCFVLTLSELVVWWFCCR